MAQVASLSVSSYVIPKCNSRFSSALPPRSSKIGSVLRVKQVSLKAVSKQTAVSCNGSKDTSCRAKVSEDSEDGSLFLQKMLLFCSTAAAPILLDSDVAQAVDGAFGVLESKPFALAHPIIMGSLFLFTVWAGYLGLQWRRVRTLGDDISALKAQIPKKAEEGSPPSPLEAEVAKLTETRKALVKGGFKDRHFNAGSILLGLGVTTSVAGCLNTWFRTGKLFPGPHLWAGAGITVLWALAAAMVPVMQKGNETARSAHIALNTINLLLFVWQIPTGFDIVSRILGWA